MTLHAYVLTTAAAAEWHSLLARLPHSDIYFTPEYHRAYERNGDGEALLFVAEEGAQLYVHPFLLRAIRQVGGQPLTDPLYDSTTVYGYGGPLATIGDPAFVQRAQEAFHAWCQSRGVVTEFIRFHPLLDNYRLAGPQYTVQLNRQTAAVPLYPVEEPLWNDYDPVHRNKIRKAGRAGLVCQELTGPEGLAHFKRLYFQTMDALQAQDLYYFSDAYYEAMLEMAQPGYLRLYVVLLEGQAIASGLFMYYGHIIHYHLSGSDLEHRKYAPNNLMLHQVAAAGGAAGYHLLHLGGGRSAAPDDSLFVFKAQIGKRRLPFYTGRRIHDEARYAALCDLWRHARQTDTLPNFFPVYRAP
ncbi:MAG: GNAT family N-acetyltransferase [Anaerolineae bacterium]|jgi:hypothetical protein|nr:GNAT family N-acetyltransferase [Anaerolineae bacterium]